MIAVEDLQGARAVALTSSAAAVPLKSGGIGYGGKREAYSALPSPDDVKIFKATGETDSDATIAQTIDMISRELKTGPHKTTIFDTLALNLFRYSLFFDSIVSLIRNDSVDNITEREALYAKVFSLLQILASQEDLCKIIVSPRPNMKDSPGLWELNDTWSPSSEVEKLLPPVLSSLENTYTQAQTFIELAEKHSGAGSK